MQPHGRPRRIGSALATLLSLGGLLTGCGPASPATVQGLVLFCGGPQNCLLSRDRGVSGGILALAPEPAGATRLIMSIDHTGRFRGSLPPGRYRAVWLVRTTTGTERFPAIGLRGQRTITVRTRGTTTVRLVAMGR